MTRSDLTHLFVLLDRSGSMQSIKSDIVGGFDAFVAEQRSATGECRMTLARFDNEYEQVFADLPIAQVGPLVLEPRGSTALLDSMARIIRDTGAWLAAMPEEERPGTVILGVMTDGMENASKEWTHAAVKALVEEQEEKYDWTISYLGANQDAIEVGARMGVARERSLTYAGGKVADAMAVYSESVDSLKAARAAGMDPKTAKRAAAFSRSQRNRAT